MSSTNAIIRGVQMKAALQHNVFSFVRVLSRHSGRHSMEAPLERTYSTTTSCRQSSVLKQRHKSPTFPVIANADIDKNDATFLRNLDHSNSVISQYQDIMAMAMAGGGERAVKRLRSQHKLLAHERLSLVLDDVEDFLELSPLAGLGIDYGEVTNVPRAGAIFGIGRVCGQYCAIFVNDSSIKGGTIFPIGVTKQLRGQEIAEQNRLPCIMVVDSGGAFLQLQADIFPDKNHGGKTFANEAIMSALGIPQIAVVCGDCTAGGAYLPTMADEAIIVDKMGKIFLGGPPLVKAATGEITSAEDLGGATLHSSISGCTDYFAKTEQDAYMTCRDLISTLNLPEHTFRSDMTEPLFDAEDMLGLIPSEAQHTMDMYKVIARIVDGSRFHEFKAMYGPSLITGFAHIDGFLVGIVGNNGEMTDNAAVKASHFVEMCSERRVPIIFLQNTAPPGGEFTSPQHGVESGLTLKAHSKMMACVSCAPVPKLTVVVGNSYGVERYLMGGRAISPNFLFLWPNAKVGLMDADSLALTATMLAQAGDETMDIEVTHSEMLKKFTTETSAFYSSSRIWDDGVIEPRNTRKVLSQCLRIIGSGVPVRESPKYPVLRM